MMIASPIKRSGHADLQESNLPTVVFNARLCGNGVVYVQIRRKEGKDTFAIWVAGPNMRPIDEKIGSKKLEEALSGNNILTLSSGVKITKLDLSKIRKILNIKVK